jgi:hypothetical protein
VLFLPDCAPAANPAWLRIGNGGPLAGGFLAADRLLAQFYNHHCLLLESPVAIGGPRVRSEPSAWWRNKSPTRRNEEVPETEQLRRVVALSDAKER